MDRYSRIVLTVIATALVALVLQNAGVLRARADVGDGPAKVQLCNSDGTYCAHVDEDGRVSISRHALGESIGTPTH
ncbi:MAG: hypothetical protein KGI51_01805 [Rhodospirillales bacterium]|nr:hypothetical protein [Rhodospirillales bacterium]